MLLKWTQHSEEGCPTCNRMEGKVKSEAGWENSNVRPKVNTECGEFCECTLEEVSNGLSEETSVGTLAPAAQLTESQSEVTLQLSASVTPEGFQILAITEGEAKGHGISFSADVLLTAIPHYQDKPVFIDHAGLGNSPSVRDLAGTLTAVGWNDTHKGIEGKLIPAGPAADVLATLRDAAIRNPAIMQTVGFSTVLNVRLQRDGQVLEITRVKSIDVVIEPARGGRFLSSALGAKTEGGLTMSEELKSQGSDGHATESPAALQLEANRQAVEANRQAAAILLGDTERSNALEAQLQESNDILVAQCEHLLTSGLASSKLPEVVQKRVRRQFAGRAFKAVELSEAISEAREELTALTAAQNVSGPGRLQIIADSNDQFRLAVEDLFGVERETSQKHIKVHRLSGIREAYLLGTGDEQFMGGFYPEFALVSANFPAIVANVMNKILLMAWSDFESVYGWWQKIATVEHFTNLNDVSWVKTGTIASLPTIAERGEYTELPIGDTKETTAWGKSGGYVPLTIEAVLRDDVRAFTRMPRECALAGIRNVSEKVAEIFTTGSAAGPLMNDTGRLFNSTVQATLGGHLNLLTTALGTDYTAWNAVATAMYKKKMVVSRTSAAVSLGKPLGIKPSICLVPADLIAAAEALFLPRWESNTNAIEPVGLPSYGGKVEPIGVPEWTDATDWAAVINPKLMPGVMIGEIFGVKPQIFTASSEIDAAMFANDESRIKVRQFLAVGVADDMPLHKSNVGG